MNVDQDNAVVGDHSVRFSGIDTVGARSTTAEGATRWHAGKPGSIRAVGNGHFLSVYFSS
jgi:hypothetical protein